MKPVVLDACACEGGATRGYQQAGYEVHAIDILPRFRKRNPAERFIAGDAIDFMARYGDNYDLRHASVPCQRYSITNAARQANYPDLIGPMREAMQLSDAPYVLENVVGAPLLDPVMLCWQMFREPGSVLDDDGTPLRMERHRLFETSFPMAQPHHAPHDTSIQVAGAYGGARRDKVEARTIRKGGYVPSIPVIRELLGIDWMTQHGMFQSIPPAYAEYVGRVALNFI